MQTKNLPFILIALFCMSYNTNAQTPNWNWAANNSNGTYNDAGNSVAVDSMGNVYVTGTFGSPTLTLDGITLTRQSEVGTDIFISKYDPTGNIIWAKNFGGGTYETYSNCIAVDNGGNIYVTGWFATDTLNFGTIHLANTNYSNYDLFIAKLKNNGDVIWAKSAGGTGTEKGNSITIDNNGYIYFTGVYSSNFTLGGTTLTNAGSYDLFVAKYDINGNDIWVKSVSGTAWDESYCLSVDASGNVYITGTFTSSTLTFGSITLTNAGSADMFIAKYDGNGNVVWSKSTGGNDYETASSVMVNDAGDIYATGSFSSPTVSFGSTTLNRVSGDDLFIVKYNNAGNEIWAKSIGGNGNDRGECIDIDNVGNIYITGWFSSSSLSFGSTTLINAGGRNIFVSKWNDLGNVTWAISPYGNNYHSTKSGKVDALGNVHVTGDFLCSTLTFGSSILTNCGIPNTGDIFIAKLGNATLALPEIEKKEKLIIFPNPFSSVTNIQTDLFLNDATLTCYNAFGQVVQQIEHISGHTVSMFRNDLPTGTYFMLLAHNNQIISTNKLIITD
jgi:hypothetical protein